MKTFKYIAVAMLMTAAFEVTSVFAKVHGIATLLGHEFDARTAAMECPRQCARNNWGEWDGAWSYKRIDYTKVGGQNYYNSYDWFCGCIKHIGTVCSFDDECKSGHCCSGVCQECCTANSDCPSGKPICSDNKCVDKLPNDRICKGDYDCRSGHCCSGVCRECCYSNSDCPQGKICNQFRCLTGN